MYQSFALRLSCIWNKTFSQAISNLLIRDNCSTTFH